MKYEEKHKNLRKWLEERKELSIRAIEAASDIPSTTLSQVINKAQRTLPEHHWPKLEKTLKKYGWEA